MILIFIFLAVLTIGIIGVAGKKYPCLGKLLINLCLLAFFFFAALCGMIVLAFTTPNAGIYSIFLAAAAVGLALLFSCLLWGVFRKKAVWIPTICFLALVLVSSGGYRAYECYLNSIPTVGEAEDLLLLYAPYGQNSKVVVLDEPATLRLSEEIPRLDGATALFPVYSAFARAVYPEEALADYLRVEGNQYRMNENPYLKCTKTANAYESIISGNADMIFVAAPSEEQAQTARDNGVELTFTPIGKEAFVFFVNAKNPIENLSLEEIRQIYSGEIMTWSELGADHLGEIRAFQRDEGSGSQSALERLMTGKNLIQPPTENRISGMGGIIKQTADYKNFKNAIGFSFRFYSTEMVQNNQIKLLQIDNVFPNTDNIENGSYPISSDFYAVTRSDANANTLRLLEWILGSQGQEIVAKTGYTPLAASGISD